MPKSSLELNIDKATNENNVSEDWGLTFEIVDQINQTNKSDQFLSIYLFFIFLSLGKKKLFV